MLEFGGMQSTPSLPSFLGSLWPEVVAPDRLLCMDQIELNCVLCFTELHEIELFWYLNCMFMQNWIVWKRNVIDIETALSLNWIFWNRTVLIFNCVWTRTILLLNWIVWIRTVWLNWIAWKRNVFCIKIDLALNPL